MNLEISGAEAAILRETLASAVSDLRMEVVDTEEQGLREELKAREQALLAVLDRLGRGST